MKPKSIPANVMKVGRDLIVGVALSAIVRNAQMVNVFNVLRDMVEEMEVVVSNRSTIQVLLKFPKNCNLL